MILTKIRVYFRERIIIFSIVSVLLMQIFIWIYSIYNLKDTQGTLLLHSNIQFGVDYIGDKMEFFILPATGLVFAIINFIFSFFLFVKERILSFIFAVFTVAVEILLLAASIYLIYINT